MEISSKPLASGPAPMGLAAGSVSKPDDALTAAKALEAEFIKFMLKEAKVGAAPGLGQSGDQDQWLSFLHDALAARIVEQGGIGLSDKIVIKLK